MPDRKVLSRSCIRDTFLAKKNGAYRSSGLALSLYVANIRRLRSTQLSPCKESAQPLRYLRLAEQKKAAPELIIVLRGGRIDEVQSTNPYVKAYVADYDHPSDSLNEIEEIAAHLHMHMIYPSEE